MSQSAVRSSVSRTTAPVRTAGAPILILASTLAVGVLHGLFVMVLYVLLGSATVPKLFQGIASALIGPASAYRGGAATFALGVALHFTVALCWSIVFLIAMRSTTIIPRVLASRLGALKIATVFGLLVYVAMSFALVPLFTHRVPPINAMWIVVLLGHIPFVGLPIASILGRAAPEWTD